MQGQWDSPLTARGRDHARTSGRVLARLGVDAVFASPLGRVRETLAILAEHVAIPPVFVQITTSAGASVVHHVIGDAELAPGFPSGPWRPA